MPIAVDLAGGDKASDDDVFLETAEHVDLAGGGGVDEHADGFLEGCAGEPAVGGQCHARDPQEQLFVRGGLAGLGLFGSLLLLQDALVLVVDIPLVGDFAGEEGGGAGIGDADLAEHLADDDLQVLVVDRLSLGSVDVLHFLHDVVLHGVHAFLFQRSCRLK
jgi:hypothetical protein